MEAVLGLRRVARSVQPVFQTVTFYVIVGAGLGLIGYTLACFLGLAEWLSLSLTFGETVFEDAGMTVQFAVSVLVFGLMFFLPTNARILALETSHRRFHIGMEDVSRAYRLAHAEDRAGAFNLQSEFDSIRQRMAFLRDHPDLTDLEPSVLEVAAQMSHISRELARIYSEGNVSRARDFLMQRQNEIEEFNSRIDTAKSIASEMRQWTSRIEMEESMAQSQLARLREELAEIMPEFLTPEPDPDTPADAAADTDTTIHALVDDIVALDSRRAAE